MFVRFSTHTRDADSLLGEGVFTAACQLRDGGHLAAYEHALLAETLDWFDQHLNTPSRFGRSIHTGAASRAICWFKCSAHTHLDHAWDLVALLEHAGTPVSMITRERVGYVVYEDEHQIAAEPFGVTRRYLA